MILCMVLGSDEQLQSSTHQWQPHCCPRHGAHPRGAAPSRPAAARAAHPMHSLQTYACACMQSGDPHVHGPDITYAPPLRLYPQDGCAVYVYCALCSCATAPLPPACNAMGVQVLPIAPWPPPKPTNPPPAPPPSPTPTLRTPAGSLLREGLGAAALPSSLLFVHPLVPATGHGQRNVRMWPFVMFALMRRDGQTGQASMQRQAAFAPMPHGPCSSSLFPSHSLRMTHPKTSIQR